MKKKIIEDIKEQENLIQKNFLKSTIKHGIIHYPVSISLSIGILTLIGSTPNLYILFGVSTAFFAKGVYKDYKEYKKLKTEILELKQQAQQIIEPANENENENELQNKVEHNNKKDINLNHLPVIDYALKQSIEETLSVLRENPQFKNEITTLENAKKEFENILVKSSRYQSFEHLIEQATQNMQEILDSINEKIKQEEELKINESITKLKVFKKGIK